MGLLGTPRGYALNWDGVITIPLSSLFSSYEHERCALLATPANVYGPHQRPTIMEAPELVVEYVGP